MISAQVPSTRLVRRLECADLRCAGRRRVPLLTEDGCQPGSHLRTDPLLPAELEIAGVSRVFPGLPRTLILADDFRNFLGTGTYDSIIEEFSEPA